MDFSPDGRRIALTWADSTDAHLAVVNTDGTGLRMVPDGKQGIAPLWSPDGRRIVFESDVNNGAVAKLFDVTANITRTLPEIQAPFAWREDGRRLAGIRLLRDGARELVWYDVFENAVTHRSKLPAFGPANDQVKMYWIPGTDDVAYLGDDQGRKTRDVYTVEGGEAKRITTTGDVVTLGISGDGRTLIWVRGSPNTKYILLSVYTYDLTTRSVARLPFPNRVAGINPSPQQAPAMVDYVAISPSCDRLALVAGFLAPGSKPGRDALLYHVCYTVNMDGSGARMLRKTAVIRQNTNALLLPVWSRDGSRLGLLHADDRFTSVILFDAGGAGEHTILSAPNK